MFALSMLSAIWGTLVFLSVVWVIYDVVARNRALSDIIKVGWIIAALMLGPIGVILYYFLGRH
jgi:uncharacterized metal-binding protein